MSILVQERVKWGKIQNNGKNEILWKKHNFG